MTTLYLHDVGYIKPGQETGTAFSSATEIANGGTELPLKGVTIGYARGLTFDNKPQPGAFTETRLNFVSITNPVITLSGQIRDTGDLSSASNVLRTISDGGTTSITDQDGSSSTDEIDILFILDLMCKTRGYKELYYKDASSNNNILYGIGSTDTFNSTYRHLHVRCKGLRITQNGDSSLITWQLTCEIEKGE